MRLSVADVSWGVEGKRIVDNVSLEVGAGEFVALLGPNGSGKSSLLKTIYRQNRPDSGVITLNGQNVWKLTAREMALRAAVVVQEPQSEFDFSVHEIVMMGRYPHKDLLAQDDAKDYDLVDEALQRVGMADFHERDFSSLSGGEKQRVLLARALVQQPEILILDEPTNHLDIHYQIEALELVKDLGVTVIAALHDLNLAALFCERVYVLQAGSIVASGTPEDVLRSELIRTVYNVASDVKIHPATGKLHIAFFPERADLVPEKWTPS